MTDVKGRVAIVTGGAGGIGSAIARNLVEQGARVAIADLDPVRSAAVVTELGTDNAIAVKLDVTSDADWAAARDEIAATLGPVDIIVNNAGVAFVGALDTIALDGWRWVYEVNLIATLRSLQTFLPDMKARGGAGHVVLVCSSTALHPYPTHGAYTTSKAALLNLATVLKRELEGTAIGVTAACPGTVGTDLRENANNARPSHLHTDAVSQLSVKAGMHPSFVGKAIVDGLRADKFFVFTHSDYAASVASDRDLMLAAMQAPADPDYREAAVLTAPLPR